MKRTLYLLCRPHSYEKSEEVLRRLRVMECPRGEVQQVVLTKLPPQLERGSALLTDCPVRLMGRVRSLESYIGTVNRMIQQDIELIVADLLHFNGEVIGKEQSFLHFEQVKSKIKSVAIKEGLHQKGMLNQEPKSPMIDDAVRKKAIEEYQLTLSIRTTARNLTALGFQISKSSVGRIIKGA